MRFLRQMGNNKEIIKIMQDLDNLRYRQGLILTALRNLLAQNNPNEVNDYLISIMEREK